MQCTILMRIGRPGRYHKESELFLNYIIYHYLSKANQQVKLQLLGYSQNSAGFQTLSAQENSLLL